MKKIINILLCASIITISTASLSAEELPVPTYDNALIVSIEHSITDLEEVDYIKNYFPLGLYTWLAFSHTHIDPVLDWHAGWGNADNGIQDFKDKIELYIHNAKEKDVRLHIVLCAGLSRGLSIYREAKDEDIRNCQWYNDNKLAANDQISESDPLDKYVFGTLSRYARKMQHNLRAKSRAALAFLKLKMDQEPEIFAALSGWGEAELNFNRIIHSQSLQDYFCDYSPFAVLEFRDWTCHEGLYNDVSGQYKGQGYSEGGGKYQGLSGLLAFNQDFGTSFTLWDLKYFNWSLDDDYDTNPKDQENDDPHRIPLSEYNHGSMKPASGPNFTAGGFDPPRTMEPGNKFWDLWNLFRETMVHNYVKDVARWAAAAGIPDDRWYSHQIAGDYLFGTSPDSQDKNPRYHSSASPLWTADIPPLGSPGATLYDIKFPDRFARSTKHGLEALSSLSSNWAIMEYDAETYPTGFNVSESSVEDILAQYLNTYSFGPHIINFWRWKDSSGEHQIKGMNKQQALIRFVRQVRDIACRPDLNTVFDPPQVVEFSGVHNESSGKNILSISGRIWKNQNWEWKEWGDFSRFEIYRGESPDFAADEAHLLAGIEDYEYDDNTAKNWKVYYYKIRAVNSQGTGGQLSREIQLPEGVSYLLSLKAGQGGTTKPVPGIYDYYAGYKVNVEAVAEVGFFFSEWSGDVSGGANPMSVLMDKDKSITAHFSEIEIQPPINFKGQIEVNRAWIIIEYVHRLTWEADPRNINVEQYRIYEVQDSTQVLIAELDSAIFEYMRRDAEKNRDYTYEIRAVDMYGNESLPGVITVND